MNIEDLSIINFLLNYAKRPENKWTNKFTICSCLVFNKKRYGLSINNYYNENVLSKKYGFSNEHSEIKTILKSIKYLSKKQLNNSTLYITGLSKSKNCNLVKSSKPCNKCQNVINIFGIKNVIYTESLNNKELIIKKLNKNM